jgi:membrane-bound ClpP family serine protease
MSKYRIRNIGIAIFIIGLILSVSEFLIDNSEVVLGVGLVILLASFLIKK